MLIAKTNELSPHQTNIKIKQTHASHDESKKLPEEKHRLYSRSLRNSSPRCHPFFHQTPTDSRFLSSSSRTEHLLRSNTGEQKRRKRNDERKSVSCQACRTFYLEFLGFVRPSLVPAVYKVQRAVKYFRMVKQPLLLMHSTTRWCGRSRRCVTDGNSQLQNRNKLLLF